jgi:hypothetical protein
VLRRARREGRSRSYLALLVSVAIVATLTFALLRPAGNRLLSPHLGAELHSPDGAALPLDRPAAPRP